MKYKKRHTTAVVVAQPLFLETIYKKYKLQSLLHCPQKVGYYLGAFFLK
jgi:hypothetical protein